MEVINDLEETSFGGCTAYFQRPKLNTRLTPEKLREEHQHAKEMFLCKYWRELLDGWMGGWKQTLPASQNFLFSFS